MDKGAVPKVFRQAQLCLEFHKNRDGTKRDVPHVMYPKDGRISVPSRRGDDEEGRLAYLSISRVDKGETAVFLEQHQVCLIDDVTQTRIVFDGELIQILIGHGEGQRFYQVSATGSGE